MLIPAEPCVGPGKAITWSVRPDAIEIDADGPIEATVADVAELPTLHEATLQLTPSFALIARNPRQPLRTGARCRISISPDAILTWAT
ncbi:MAG: TOBE domain-containing protein [Actinobacteria bacterium]|nr:TOBE domain-containing protein [Actinomycetota bacterium]